MIDAARVNALIARIAAGDEAALDELYAVMGGRLFYVALSVVRNRATAEEVVHDGFLRIVNNADKFRRRDNGPGWCAAVVRNLALNRVKSDARFRAGSIDDFFDLTDGADMGGDAALRLSVQEAMKRLSADDRRLIVLRYYSDMTVRDIAKAVGLGKSTVARRLDEAQRVLKKYLE